MTLTPISTTRQTIRLADGRELIYFDRTPGRDRSAPDERADLPGTPCSSELRWDPLFEDYAVIAGHRQSRTYHPPVSSCPLCPSRPGAPTEIPASDYEVVVFENRFPAFSSHGAPGAGRCEVICFCSDHDRPFAELPEATARAVVDAWADRTSELGAAEGIEFVFCFENRGEEIGVTLAHPHGQIYGYPFVPPRFARAGRSAQRHRAHTDRCLQCDQLAQELADEERVVVKNADWVAYVPYAARWPYEVRIVPRTHVPDIPAVSSDERGSLVEIYQDVLRRIDRLFDEPAPYIAAWLQAPVRDYRDAWHLAAEVFTIRRGPNRLKYLAGAESSAATWINDVAPEIAAAQLRTAR